MAADGDVTLVAANVASLSIESFLYGVFFVLFATSTWFLLHRAKQSPCGIRSVLSKPLFLAGSAMFCTVTAHWILTVKRVFDAVAHVDEGASPTVFFNNLTIPTAIAKIVLVNASLLVGDAVLVYRLWVIWGYNKHVVALPLIYLIGSFGSCVALSYVYTESDSVRGAFIPSIEKWTAAASILTLLTNLFCSHVGLQAYGAHSLMHVLVICVESALLYVTWAAVYLAVYESGSKLQQTIADAWGPMSGITFMLITFRVALGLKQDSDPSPTNYVDDLVFAMGDSGAASSMAPHDGISAVNMTIAAVSQEYDLEVGKSCGQL